MRRVMVEYIGGPADGRQEPVPVGANGEPASWRAVPEVWAHLTGDRPIAPSAVHRYEREPRRGGWPRTFGTRVWRYHHRGAFG